jgi:hypothetical protein
MRIAEWLGARSWSWLAGAFALGWATPAAAAPLAFTGSLAILVGPFGVGVPGAGFAEVDGHGHLGQLGVPASSFQVQGLVVPITTTQAAPISGLQITAANQSGVFDNPGGGTMPLLGSAKVCLYGACSAAVANLTVPLDVVGRAASVTVTGPVSLTVVGAPWTIGTAQVGSETAMGFAYGPGSQTSSTARASGAIQLVTPIAISTNLPSDFAQVAAFAVMTLHFVPEPTTLVLLGAGIAITAALGRRSA